jgi:hypothetical protein
MPLYTPGDAKYQLKKMAPAIPSTEFFPKFPTCFFNALKGKKCETKRPGPNSAAALFDKKRISE